jgi:hypothetical protein
VDPSVPAASTTTSANTNVAGASKRVRPFAPSSNATFHPPPAPVSAGATVRTDASQKTSAPWATASGR